MDDQQTLTPGMHVIGSDGDKIGTMVLATNSYIVVEKGFFLPKDYYVPFDRVVEADDDNVYLSVTKNEIVEQGWDIEPADSDESYDQALSDRDYRDQAAVAVDVDQDTLRVPVHEEHLAASKRTAQAGEVTINKRVVTEQETIQVPVTEERVEVRWTAPTGEVTEEGEVFEEGTIEIPVSREVVDVSKRTVQTGELEVTKEREQRTQKVTDSVRREVIDVDDTTVEGEPGRGTR